MKKNLLRTFTFMASIAFLYFGCQEDKSNLFLPEIKDYPHKNSTNALFEAADEAKYAQDFKKADKAFRGLLNQTLTTADSQYVLNQLAFINLAMNQDSVAMQWIQLLERTKPPLSKEALADYNYNIGLWAYHNFKPKMAEAYLREALTGYQTMYGDRHLRVALCMTQLGMVYWDFTTSLDTVFKYIEKADTIFMNQKTLENFSHDNELAMACVSLAKRSHEAGQTHCDIALNISNKKPYRDLIFMGRCLSMKGNMLKKKAFLEKDKAKQSQLYKEADDCFKRAIDLVKNTSSLRIQEFYRDYIVSKSREKDANEVFKSIAILENLLLTQPDIYAQPDRLKAKYYFLAEKYDTAAIWYERFYERYKSDTLKNASLMGEINFCLIESYIKLNKHDEALFFLKKDLALGTKYESANLDWATILTPAFYKEKLYQFVAFGEAGKIFLSKYKTTHRLSDLENALKVLELTDELLFKGILTSDEDAILTYQKEVSNGIYPLALEVVYELKQIKSSPTVYNLAFRYSERVKSFLLYRDLAQAPQSSDIPANLADSIKLTTANINKLKWENQQKNLKIGGLNELSDLQRKLDAYYEIIKKQYPHYHKLKIAQPIPNIQEVMKMLEPNQGVIQYSFHKEQLYALLMVNGQSYFHRLDSTKRLIQNINDYLSYLKTPTTDPLSKNHIIKIAQQLYDDLLGFTPSLKTITDLVIIPDGDLNNLPFEALIEPNPKGNTEFQNTAFLQKRLNISYTPSWKIYENNYRYNMPIKPEILAMTYGDTDKKGALPKATDEINALKRCFINSNRLVLTGQNCSKENFLKHYTKFDIIHLSLHAQSNLSDRKDNKIYFKIPISNELYGFELLSQQLKAYLVILSACETAIGKTETGEGTYSLSRAFLQRGAKNVVASLWKIDDQISAQLFDGFYTELSKKQTPKKALNMAKRHFLQTNKADEIMSNPCYWAGLMILD